MARDFCNKPILLPLQYTSKFDPRFNKYYRIPYSFHRKSISNDSTTKQSFFQNYTHTPIQNYFPVYYLGSTECRKVRRQMKTMKKKLINKLSHSVKIYWIHKNISVFHVWCVWEEKEMKYKEDGECMFNVQRSCLLNFALHVIALVITWYIHLKNANDSKNYLPP